jgi:hypothetical protein
VSEANSIETRVGWWRCDGGEFAHVQKPSVAGSAHIGLAYTSDRQWFLAWNPAGKVRAGNMSFYEKHRFNLVEYLGTEDPRTPVIEVPEMRPEPEPSEPVRKYHRQITHTLEHGAIIQTGDRVTITVDVYDVLKAFDVRCPAIQHAIKKLLCAGIRGHKDKRQDLAEARASIGRAIELEVADGMP